MRDVMAMVHAYNLMNSGKGGISELMDAVGSSRHRRSLGDYEDPDDHYEDDDDVFDDR